MEASDDITEHGAILLVDFPPFLHLALRDVLQVTPPNVTGFENKDDLIRGRSALESKERT